MGTTNYAGTATNHATITLPDDAEYAASGIAAVNTPLEELKDLIEYVGGVAFDTWVFDSGGAFAVSTSYATNAYGDGTLVSGASLPEITIADCKAGDIIEAHFVGVCDSDGAAVDYPMLRIAVEEDGVVVSAGGDVPLVDTTTPHVLNTHFICEVNADSDVTVRVQGKKSSGAGTYLQIQVNATLSIKRMRAV